MLKFALKILPLIVAFAVLGFTPTPLIAALSVIFPIFLFLISLPKSKLSKLVFAVYFRLFLLRWSTFALIFAFPKLEVIFKLVLKLFIFPLKVPFATKLSGNLIVFEIVPFGTKLFTSLAVD